MDAVTLDHLLGESASGLRGRTVRRVRAAGSSALLLELQRTVLWLDVARETSGLYPLDRAAADRLREAATGAPDARARQALLLFKKHLEGRRMGEPARIGGERAVVVEADGAGRIEGGPALDAATVERLACDAAVVPVSVDGEGEVLNLGRRSRHPNRAQRRAMALRDGRRCQFPGCPATRFTQAHHVDWWERDKGETNLDVLVTLCRFHHRLVHRRVVGVVKTDHGFAFVRSDGSPVDDGRPLVGTPSGATGFARVDALTAVPRWGGERLDLDLALTALFSWETG